MPLSFEERSAELHRLEAVAKAQGLSERAFEMIALEVNVRGNAAGVSFEDQLAEIRRRVMVKVGEKR
jgi:RecA-family ATPase